MEYKQHRIIAPIFTGAMTVILAKAGLVKTENLLVTTAISIATSNLTAVAPDGDLYATYPVRVILGHGSYKVRRGGVIKTYHAPKDVTMKVTAILFKLLRVRKHRSFITHSPTLHIPLGIALYYLVNRFIGNMYLNAAVLGLVLGYWSHLAADAPNKGGIPLIPGAKDFSLPKLLLPNSLANLFRSGSGFMMFLLMAGLFELILFAISPDLVGTVNHGIWSVIAFIGRTLWGLIKTLINALMKVTGAS